MGNFTFIECGMEGLYLIEPKVYGDQRGYFMETYQYEDFKAVGLAMSFVQDNQSYSRKGVLRGLHFQRNHPQGKLVRVFNGMIYDAVVDLRKSSKTYGKWHGVILSDENKRMLYVPEGFAHGFLVLSEEATFTYKCTDYYHPEDEGGILWNDRDLNIQWPISEDMVLNIAERDRNFPALKECGIQFDR